MGKAKTAKRSDGLYQKAVTLGRNPDGTYKRKYIYAKTKRELQEKVAEYTQRAKQGTLSNDEKMTFGELAQTWIDDYKPTIGETTRRRYRAIIKNHFADISFVKVTELKPFHLQSIINRLAEQGYAEKTLKEIKITAAQILEIGVQNDIVFRNVFSKVEIPRTGSTERRALKQEEIDLILKTYQGHRFGLSALLLLFCGIRRGELLALTWNDIDRKNKLLHINKAVYFVNNKPFIKPPKSQAGIRDIPIPDVLLPILQKAEKTSMMVCPSVDGELMTHMAFNRGWETYLNYLNVEAGGSNGKRVKNSKKGKQQYVPAVKVIERMTAHMLRHTYATMLYDANVDVKTAQKYLGHSDVQTTLKIYTHLSEQKEQQSKDALN